MNVKAALGKELPMAWQPERRLIREIAMQKAQVCRDKNHPNDWRVEKVVEDGGVEIAIFSGPKAQERAIYYADKQYDGHWSVFYAAV
jgi:hypothetical protein